MLLKAFQPIPVAQGVIVSERKLAWPTSASYHLCVVLVEIIPVLGGLVK